MLPKTLSKRKKKEWTLLSFLSCHSFYFISLRFGLAPSSFLPFWQSNNPQGPLSKLALFPSLCSQLPPPPATLQGSIL